MERQKTAKRKKLAPVGQPRGKKKTEGGYVRVGPVWAPSRYAVPIMPKQLTPGLRVAREQIQKMLDAMFFEDGSFEVGEVSLTVSFNAKGEFLGIGVGGATSMTITIRPKNR